MKRDKLTELKDWKQSPHRKPLLLMGARQVGKTTLLKHFGESEYENLVTLNFDDRPKLKSLFSTDLDPKRIIRDICLELDVQIKPGKTLLFFDEIQECPDALISLKYFNENANEYHVCGAGSLLGVKLSYTKGFPVGKVNFAKLYPLNFLEFLDAINQSRLKEYLLSLKLTDSINPAIHDKLLNQLKRYIFVGGMPEAVNIYRETEDFEQARIVHHNILKAYDLDFIKHAPRELVMRITECFHAITNQLAKENKKFIYNVVRPGARARSYEEALTWLGEAGLFYQVYNIETPKLPIRAYENRHIFKAYLLDVGLLATMASIPAKTILHGNALFTEFQGSLTENFVGQELRQFIDRLHYWTNENRGEIDFIWQHEADIYPIEVKSGTSSRKRSLKIYQDKYDPKWSFRTSPLNLEMQSKFANIPLYLIGLLPQLITNI